MGVIVSSVYLGMINYAKHIMVGSFVHTKAQCREWGSGEREVGALEKFR